MRMRVELNQLLFMSYSAAGDLSAFITDTAFDAELTQLLMET